VFTKLKDAHAELRTAITELETETRRHEPDEASLSNARLKLTRASSRRRALIDQEILPTLHDLSPEQQRRVDELRRGASDVALLSSRHIGDWSMRAILADWQGYRRASMTMRSAMLRRIAEESAALYPLLGGSVEEPAARPGSTLGYASIPI